MQVWDSHYHRNRNAKAVQEAADRLHEYREAKLAAHSQSLAPISSRQPGGGTAKEEAAEEPGDSDEQVGTKGWYWEGFSSSMMI